MIINVDATINPRYLAATLNHEEAMEFIMAIDEITCDYNFTIDVMKRLSLGMEKESDEHAHVFKQITELLSSIK